MNNVYICHIRIGNISSTESAILNSRIQITYINPFNLNDKDFYDFLILIQIIFSGIFSISPFILLTYLLHFFLSQVSFIGYLEVKFINIGQLICEFDNLLTYIYIFP